MTSRLEPMNLTTRFERGELTALQYQASLKALQENADDRTKGIIARALVKLEAKSEPRLHAAV